MAKRGKSKKAASGVTNTEGNDNERSGIAAQWDMPPSPEWGGQGSDPPGGGYGPSDSVEEVDLEKKAGKDMLADGYEEVDADNKPFTASFVQDVPKSNDFNRGDDIHRRDISNKGPTVGDGRDGRSRENLG